MTPDSNRIAEFPDGLWRVSWVGPIRANSAVPSEAMVYVVLAGLKENPGDPFLNRALNYKYNTCWVGVGKIPLLRLGGVWRDKAREYGVSPPESRLLQNIDPCKVSHLTLQQLFAGPTPIVEAKFWPLGPGLGACASSGVVAIEHAGDSYGILIPDYVIFQNYYGTSTRLSKGIIMGTLGDYFNLSGSHLGQDGVAFVHLRLRGKITDAWTMARIVSSDPMWKAVCDARKTFQAQSINDEPLNFRFPLPFETRANWRASVRWIPNGPHKWRALVLTIDRCDAPFGFDSVSYHCDGDNRQGENKDDPGLAPAWGGEWLTTDPIDLPDVHKDIEEPDKDVKPAEFENPLARFAFLEGKALTRDPKRLQKSRSAGRIKKQRTDYDGLGTGDGTDGESDQHPSNITDDPSTVPVPALLEDFVETVRRIAENDGVSVAMRVLMEKSQLIGDRWALTWFPTYLNNERVAWSFVGEYFTTPRRIAIAEIRTGERFGYLMEIERRPSEHFSTLVLCRHDGAVVSHGDLFRIVALTATRLGWPMEKQLPGYRTKRKRHPPGETTLERAGRLLDALKSIGLEAIYGNDVQNIYSQTSCSGFK